MLSMNLSRLVRRGLWFHRRSNFAVLMGVAVGTAVLTGALLVGDSLRGSLRQRALRQIGLIEAVALPGRFFDERLADRVGVEPAIVLGATAQVVGGETVTDVTVYAFRDEGVISGFGEFRSTWDFDLFDWRTWTPPSTYRSIAGYSPLRAKAETMYLSPPLADALKLSGPANVRLRLPRPTAIPRDTAFGRTQASDLTAELVLETQTLDAADPAAHLSLLPSGSEPRTVFVTWSVLQQALSQPGRANALIRSGPSDSVAARLASALTATDYGLTVRTPLRATDDLLRRSDSDGSSALEPREYRRRLPAVTVTAADGDGDKKITRDELLTYLRGRGSLAVESANLFVPAVAEHAAAEAARGLGLRFAPTISYLANSISDGTNDIPYSVIAALDALQPAPLGPFLPPGAPPLADDEIILADWAESPLTAKPGDAITVRYFKPESEGSPVEATATFRLRGKVPMTGVAADPYLTPEFPGITDKLTLGEWDPPFPYDNKRITKRDEEYWDEYRTTPKAYISLATGRRLFGSRFGVLTSIRIAPRSPESLEADAAAFEKTLLSKLKPEDFGYVFQDVRARALAASKGSSDFGWLFVGFSFYLIAAALMLVGLLVRLNLEQRASEVGLLLAAGYRPQTIRRLWLSEGLIVAVGGGLLGLILAVGYGWLMLRLLAALWPAGEVGSFLELHIRPLSLVIGYFGSLVMCAATIAWALRAFRRVAPAMLLRGVVTTEDDTVAKPIRAWPATALAVLGLLVTASGLFVHGHEARAGAFFAGGAALLAAGLLALRWRLRSRDRVTVKPADSLATLGARNVARNPTRSLLTAGLLAAAAFLLVAVESFRRSPEADFATRTGGSGGFALVATTDLPLFQDPNVADAGRKEMLDNLERDYQKDPATKAARLDAARELLTTSQFIPLRVRAGDDAGCRNLYQPTKPRLVGVPHKMIERGGFAFASSLAETPEDKANPWQLLEKPATDAVPVFADATSATWILKKSLGDTLSVTDSRGQPVTLRLVGLLRDCIFQGELLMAESQFLKLDPDAQGYAMLLADTAHAGEVKSILETAYADRGLVATPAVERLRSYLAVENTYLSTFQVLGGFGLLLGVLGLAVVMLRAAAERRGELALLRATGFRAAAIGRMVLAENAVLIAAGLAIGVAAALVSIAPPLMSGEPAGGDLLRTAVFLALVCAAAVGVCWWVTRRSLRAAIVPALRGE